jgi:hypothetical protein
MTNDEITENGYKDGEKDNRQAGGAQGFVANESPGHAPVPLEPGWLREEACCALCLLSLGNRHSSLLI